MAWVFGLVLVQFAVGVWLFGLLLVLSKELQFAGACHKKTCSRGFPECLLCPEAFCLFWAKRQIQGYQGSNNPYLHAWARGASCSLSGKRVGLWQLEHSSRSSHCSFHRRNHDGADPAALGEPSVTKRAGRSTGHGASSLTSDSTRLRTAKLPALSRRRPPRCARDSHPRRGRAHWACGAGTSTREGGQEPRSAVWLAGSSGSSPVVGSAPCGGRWWAAQRRGGLGAPAPQRRAMRHLPYFCRGEVVKGFGRGSKELGIPTGERARRAHLPGTTRAGCPRGWARPGVAGPRRVPEALPPARCRVGGSAAGLCGAPRAEPCRAPTPQRCGSALTKLAWPRRPPRCPAGLRFCYDLRFPRTALPCYLPAFSQRLSSPSPALLRVLQLPLCYSLHPSL